MNIIGFDFSINKPAACIWNQTKRLGIDDDYVFFGWPYNLSQRIEDIYRDDAKIAVINDRHLELDTLGSKPNPYYHVKEKEIDVSAKMRNEVENAQKLSQMITATLRPWLQKDTLIGFEGLSFGSKGDVVLQLGGYKYVIMMALSEFVPYENMFTYSPITVKKTAECSKRGMNKNDVIESFINNSHPNKLKTALKNNRDLYMKKGNKNFIDHLDDLVDSYWVLETLRDKEL